MRIHLQHELGTNSEDGHARNQRLIGAGWNTITTAVCTLPGNRFRLDERREAKKTSYDKRIDGRRE
jgi:hypothetical protein